MWRQQILMIILLGLVSGCASKSDGDKYDDGFSNMSTEQKMNMCTKIYRDARVACQDGLQNQQASRSMECLSAQLLLDRHCLLHK